MPLVVSSESLQQRVLKEQEKGGLLRVLLGSVGLIIRAHCRWKLIQEGSLAWVIDGQPAYINPSSCLLIQVTIRVVCGNIACKV